MCVVMETSAENVLQVLEGAGFERLPKPLVVAGARFDFDAAVTGTGISHDLVVLATSKTTRGRLVRLLSGLSRTLDQVESRRPVSLVLIGAKTDAQVAASLEQHARVLTIEGDDPRPDQIRRAIAVLLPLNLPVEQSQGRAPLSVVAERLGGALSKEHQSFIDAAQVGPDEVREALRRFIEAAVADSSSEGRGS